MKLNRIVATSFLITVVALCNAENQVQKQSGQPLATALEHLTVIEYDEPVVQAAVGSPTFQVERQDNKVFVKPLKAGASTNLFVWTASNQHYCYELVVGDASGMDAEIHIERSKSPQRADGQQLEQFADLVATKTLLAMEPIDSARVKSPKDGIAIRVEGVFRNKNTLFVRYSLENHSSQTFRASTPTFYEVQVDHPNVSLMSYKDQQLDARTAERLRGTKEIPIPCTYDSSEAIDIVPGATKQGIVAVRQPVATVSPMVIRLVFAENLKATMVL